MWDMSYSIEELRGKGVKKLANLEQSRLAF